MSNWIEVVSDTVINVVVSKGTPSAPTAGEYLPQPYGVGIGWTRSGGVWTGPAGEAQPVEPPPPGPQYRKLLTGWEWVATWTDSEWRQLKRAASGDLSPTPITDNVSQKLDQLLDAIRWTDSVNLEAQKMKSFYDYLVSQGFITQARADELQEGILE